MLNIQIQQQGGDLLKDLQQLEMSSQIPVQDYYHVLLSMFFPVRKVDGLVIDDL